MTQSVFPAPDGGFPWDRARPVGAELVTSSLSLQTVVSVTGRGLVKIGITSADGTQTRQARVVITIDGVVVSDFADASLARAGVMMGYGSGACSLSLAFLELASDNLPRYSCFSTKSIKSLTPAT